MSTDALAAALQRVEAVLQRRPETGLHDDAAATAQWRGGTRMVVGHPGGAEVLTDMPTELGGSGDQVSPGWLFRAGLASCAATCIACAAAADGVVLDRLDVRASSRSDTRGLLGMAGADGAPVFAGPGDVQLYVRIAAAGVAPERLRALVARGCARSPVPCAVQAALPLALHVHVDGD